VELTAFIVVAAGNAAALTWKTATETNNYGFEIERRVVKSEKTKDWEDIGFVAGSGTSSAEHSYRYTDAGVASGTYAYRLKQIDHDGAFVYSSEAEVTLTAPGVFMLNQNCPNPFNPATQISYQLAAMGAVTLKIYDLLGREIASIVNEEQSAGLHMVTWNAAGMATGVYLYQLKAGNFLQTKKMLLLK
jgi:hypothetical protein